MKAATPLAGTPAAVELGRAVTDSREVQPGDVYWAVPGKHIDGEEYIDEAFARGAVGAVAARDVVLPVDRWLLRVDDPLESLWQWAAWKRRRWSGPVIAVTGSIGKTTTRQMIQTVLGSRLRGTAVANRANHGAAFPVSLLAVEPDDEYAVLELEASEPQEMARMVKTCRPTIGVVTHAADSSASGMAHRHGAALASAELLSSLPLDGYAVLGEDPWLRRVASRSKAPITWVGRGVGCDMVAAGVQWSHGRLSFRIADCPFSVPVWGRHHLTSAMLAVAVSRLLGFALEDAAHALQRFDSVPIPCEVSEIRGATIIHDAHNASPTAMRAALELLRDFDAAGRRIVVMGDVENAGDESAVVHRQLGNQVVTLCGADVLIACGERAGDVVAAARAAGMPQRQTIACRTAEEAPPYLGQIILPGDAVLVKGSRMLAMQSVVDALRQYPRRRSA